MRRRRSAAPALLAAPLAAAAALFVAPLAEMVRQSLAGGLHGYARFFGDTYYLAALAVTIGTALLVTVIAAVVSLPLAMVFREATPRWRSILSVVLLAPFYANVVVKLFGWMVLLPASLREGYWAIVVVDVHRALPFMTLLIAASLARIDAELLESARTCGASGWRVFRTIVLPLAMPGVLAGGILVFSLTAASFVVPMLVGGPMGGRFLPVLMYQQITIAHDWRFGAVIGVVALATSTMAIALGLRLVRGAAAGRVLREGFGG
jgi:putative spermidine/putrescine transport system permease protein